MAKVAVLKGPQLIFGYYGPILLIIKAIATNSFGIPQHQVGGYVGAYIYIYALYICRYRHCVCDVCMYVRMYVCMYVLM